MWNLIVTPTPCRQFEDLELPIGQLHDTMLLSDRNRVVPRHAQLINGIAVIPVWGEVFMFFSQHPVLETHRATPDITVREWRKVYIGRFAYMAADSISAL